MKEGWTYKKLGEVCESLNGLWKGKKPPYMNVGVIRNANFTKDFTLNFDNIEYLDVEEKQYSKRKLRAGDIIVEKSGGSDKQPVGRAVLFDKSEGEYSFSNFTSVLRIKDQNEIYSAFLYKYLLYVYLGGATKKMQKATTGIHNLEFQQYLNIDVPCIEMGVQQRIVERLDAAFENIDKLKANAEKQLAEARILFQKSLAKAMEPKEGWDVDNIEHVSKEMFSGGDAPKNSLSNVKSDEFPIPVFANAVENDGLYGYTNTARVNEPALTIAARGSGTGYVLKRYEPFLPIVRLIVVVPKDSFTLDFLYYTFVSRNIRKAGSAIPQLTIPMLRKVQIYYPNSIEEQKNITKRLDSLSENIRKYEEIQRQIISECDALKQALLRKVFE